jgi:glucose-6-phosphate isomerase
MIKLTGFNQGRGLWEKLDQITIRLAKCDPTIWGQSASKEAAIRLNWVNLPEKSRELLPQLDALSAWSREFGHEVFILCGMGGSSLAPEVMAQVYKKKLTILDSTDPAHVKRVLDQDLSKSCIIIGSKSGSTIETASQMAASNEQLIKQGLDPKNHFVVITDPGSPLDIQARERNLRVVNADPNVGGRFSALSAYGLTPAALIGIDVSILLDDAYEASLSFTKAGSVVTQVAAALADKAFSFTGFLDTGSNVAGLSEWIEQLIAESTGKDGKGVLPIALSSSSSLNYPVISFDGSGSNSVEASLGEHFIFWQWVTALLGYLLQVDPFNQPNVTEAKEKTSALLSRWSKNKEVLSPVFESSSIAIYSTFEERSVASYLERAITNSTGYLAIMAYLHRGSDDQIKELAPLLERKSKLPTTFGWGPRFLHSTGQFHKGGPNTGSFIQITAEQENSWSIAGRDFGFETLIMAQALGDMEALSSRGLSVIRFHLKDRKQGIAELLTSAGKI